jgi:4'-phosphopantetheinyl transferase
MAKTQAVMGSVVSLEIPERELAAGEVHVWSLPLDMSQGSLASVAEFLSPDERTRADRFRFEVHRNRFVVGRGLLRVILGRYCDVPPDRLRFNYGPNGKPELTPGEGARRKGGALHFNLAHSEGLGVLAVTQTGPVGVDVEQVRRLTEFKQLVSQFFSAWEAAEFLRLEREQQPAAFFNLWTRKEALLKATGEGIGHSLNRVEVSFLPGEPARVLSLPNEPWAGCEWSLVDLALSPSYAGALAIPVREVLVSHFQIPCKVNELKRLKARVRQ